MLRASEVAGQQWGVIGRRQLRECGVGARTIPRWVAGRKLHEVLPGVYAFGHPSIPIEGRMVAALLYAGDGAALSHRIAGWWWGLLDEPPGRIDLSLGRRRRSRENLRVHERRRFESTHHRRFPITTLRQTYLDLAAAEPLITVRRALAQADYLRVLDLVAVQAFLGRGHPGSAALRRALDRHQPALAFTRSRTERAFIQLWEKTGLEMPEVNQKLHGWRVDFLWRREGLVVETDGHGNHRSAAQIDRDRRMDLTLRRAGLTVNRYSRQQVEEDGEIVIEDVLRVLAELSAPNRTARSAARGSR